MGSKKRLRMQFRNTVLRSHRKDIFTSIGSERGKNKLAREAVKADS